jgi:calcineurin-like phosphoesterase
MRILLVGDIYGLEGRATFEKTIARLRSESPINFVIANGENIAHGNGITEKYYRWLLDQKVNVVTLGNHAFSNQDIFNFIDDATNLVRPLNCPDGVPGKGYVTVNYNNKKITVFQVVGRTFIPGTWECPFKKTEE